MENSDKGLAKYRALEIFLTENVPITVPAFLSPNHFKRITTSAALDQDARPSDIILDTIYTAKKS